MSDRELSSGRKRRPSQKSDYEDGDNYYNTHITEERYRSMLGEHIQKYNRRLVDSSPSLVPPRLGVPVPVPAPAPKTNLGSKTRKPKNEQRGEFLETETTSAWFNGINPQKSRNRQETESAPPKHIDRLVSAS